MSEFDLLNHVLNPQTGSTVILLVVVVMLWRALQHSESIREKLHQKRVEDAEKVAEVIDQQREYHAQIREKLHETELASRDALQKNLIVMERIERHLEGR